jgi:hypothetical protein
VNRKIAAHVLNTLFCRKTEVLKATTPLRVSAWLRALVADDELTWILATGTISKILNRAAFLTLAPLSFDQSLSHLNGHIVALDLVIYMLPYEELPRNQDGRTLG